MQGPSPKTNSKLAEASLSDLVLPQSFESIGQQKHTHEQVVQHFKEEIFAIAKNVSGATLDSDLQEISLSDKAKDLLRARGKECFELIDG